MKNIQLLALSLVILSQACKSNNDSPVSPTVEAPAAVKEAILVKYPGATEMKYSVIEDSKIYKADFTNKGSKISVVTNSNSILNTFVSVNTATSDSLKSKLSGSIIQSGKFTNLMRLEAPGQPHRFVADFEMRGKSYKLTTNSAGETDIAARQLIYETPNLVDLPDKIQAFISARSKTNPNYIQQLTLLPQQLKNILLDKPELKFYSSETYSLSDGKKVYQIRVGFYGITVLPLVFDENGNLISVGNFNRLETFDTFETLVDHPTSISQADLTYFNELFKTMSELQGYSLPSPLLNSLATLNVYAGVTSYDFRLIKTGSNLNNCWTLKFDANKKLIYSVRVGD